MKEQEKVQERRKKMKNKSKKGIIHRPFYAVKEIAKVWIINILMVDLIAISVIGIIFLIWCVVFKIMHPWGI